MCSKLSFERHDKRLPVIIRFTVVPLSSFGMLVQFAWLQSTLSSETRQRIKQDGTSPSLSRTNRRSLLLVTASDKTNVAIVMKSTTNIVGSSIALLYTRSWWREFSI